MWPLAAVIPIVCCVLIPAVIAVVAFAGLGKKSNEDAPDGELPQEIVGNPARLEQRRK